MAPHLLTTSSNFEVSGVSDGVVEGVTMARKCIIDKVGKASGDEVA